MKILKDSYEIVTKNNIFQALSGLLERNHRLGKNH